MVMVQSEGLGQRVGTLPPLYDEIEVLATEDDDTLLARLRAGDELAFRTLVDRHRPWLVRLCTRLLGQDAHAAEDAAQESLLKLHRAARRDGRPLRVRPWLTVVARNTCIDEHRRRRPDLPGVLPERPVSGDDHLALDAALTQAWSRLAGRHREVLYLREVMGFSYKEIGAAMGLTMPATETLVFRARGALRREYERSGGTSFGCGVLGLQLARLGLGGRRESTVTTGVTNAAVSDPGFGGLASRLAHFLTTSLPGCGEQAVAKVLSVAAGVVVAAAAVVPGLSPFGDALRADAGEGPPVVALAAGSGAGLSAPQAAARTSGFAAPAKAASLRTLLGNAVPAGWKPSRSPGETKAPVTVPAPAPPAADPPSGRITPLRDAAAAAREADRPALNRPVRGDSGEGPLRSILPDRPERPERVERPERPRLLRGLLTDPVPLPIDPLAIDPLPIDPPTVDASPLDLAPDGNMPTEPAPVEPATVEPAPVEPGLRSQPEPAPMPRAREALQETKDGLPRRR